MTPPPLSTLARRFLAFVPADGGRLSGIAERAGLSMPEATRAAVELYRAGCLANLAPVTLNAKGWDARRAPRKEQAA